MWIYQELLDTITEAAEEIKEQDEVQKEEIKKEMAEPVNKCEKEDVELLDIRMENLEETIMEFGELITNLKKKASPILFDFNTLD